MAQADIRKANILAYLHLHVVRRVLRRLLDHGVTRENPSMRIDHFLFHHMSKINQHPIGIQNQNHLFPGFGVNANVDDWPVYLFPFLIDITGQGWLHEDFRDSVRQISQARMELYSNIVIGISEEYFEQQVKIVQTAVQRICQCISDMQFTDEINGEIRNVEEMREPPDNADYVEAFNINHHTEKSYRQRVMEFTENQQRLHDFITQNAGNYEAQDEELEDLSIRDQDHTRDLEQAHQQGHDITSRSLPPRSASGKYPINMPELTVEIDISGCNTAELHQITDRIVNSFNNSGKHSMDPANTCIKNTLDNTFTSFGEYYVRQGCIQVVVRPRSIKDMFQLLTDCVNGTLTQHLQPITEFIRMLYNCQNYEQEAVMYKDNYDHMMDNIAVQLRKKMVVSENSCKHNHYVRAEETGDRSVLLHVECHSAEDRAAFKYALQAGQMQPTLDAIRREFQHLCPDISLKARLKTLELYGKGPSQNDSTALEKIKKDENHKSTTLRTTDVAEMRPLHKVGNDHFHDVPADPNPTRHKKIKRQAASSMFCKQTERIEPTIRCKSYPVP